MVYIKPWDSEVFENLFVFLRTMQDLEEKNGITVGITVAKELYDEVANANSLREKYGLTK